MINHTDSEYIFNHAYVPEHLVAYVMSVPGAEPYLFQHYLCYTKEDVLIFIGYPLGEAFDQKQMESCLEAAAKALKPGIISLIAPTISAGGVRIVQRSDDSYYRLDLDGFTVPPGVQNMIRRASLGLTVRTGKEWSKEYENLVTEFLASRTVSEETQCIFNRIPDYVASSKTALLLSARNHKGTLIAFDVADYGSKEYAFHMFNFASREHYVPGASDLLLSEVVSIARVQGKRFINLGLAINAGIAFFKQKWGGVPFLNHDFMLYETSRAGIIESLLGRL